MNDLERPVFDFATMEEQQACHLVLKSPRQPNDFQIANKCLKHLTKDGFHSYTHFFTYVNQICTRLLSEVIIGQYYYASQKLVHSSRRAESTLQLLINQQDSLFLQWNDRNEHIINMYDSLETRLGEQTKGFEVKIETIATMLEEEKVAWINEYRRFQEAQQEEFERRQHELKLLTQAVRGFQWLSSPFTSVWNLLTISKTGFSYDKIDAKVLKALEILLRLSAKMKDWLSDKLSTLIVYCCLSVNSVKMIFIHSVDTSKKAVYELWTSIVDGIQFGYYLSEICIYTVGGLFCILLATMPPSTRWLRRFMVGLQLLKLVTSLVHLISLRYKSVDGRTVHGDQDQDVKRLVFRDSTEILSEWHIHAQVVLYLMGCTTTMFHRCFRTFSRHCYDYDENERTNKTSAKQDLNVTDESSFASPLHHPSDDRRPRETGRGVYGTWPSRDFQRDSQFTNTPIADTSQRTTLSVPPIHQPEVWISNKTHPSKLMKDIVPRGLQTRNVHRSQSQRVVDSAASTANSAPTPLSGATEISLDDSWTDSSNNVNENTKKRNFFAIESSTNNHSNRDDVMDDNTSEGEKTEVEYEDANEKYHGEPDFKRACP
jgi:hypothetical protein